MVAHESTIHRVIVLHAGHVEEWTLGCLVFWHVEGFGTKAEAMASLGGVFRSYLEGLRVRDDRKTRASCPHCKKILRESEPIDAEEVAAYIRGLIGATNDGSGEVWRSLEEAGWSIGLAGLLEVDSGLRSLQDAILLDEDGDAQVAEAAFEKSR